MCTVCGCGADETRVDGEVTHHHGHDPADEPRGHPVAAAAAGLAVDAPSDGADGAQAHHAHAPGMSPSRMVRIEQDILAKNNRYAEANRQQFRDRGLFVLNLVSSPGSGKTTLLTATIRALRERLPVAVIEGDQQTDHDAARIRATGVTAVQVNTGKGCHLDGHMVGHALERIPELQDGVLMIENVGNLVCPAAFDLGENHKVAVLSVTEGRINRLSILICSMRRICCC